MRRSAIAALALAGALALSGCSVLSTISSQIDQSQGKVDGEGQQQDAQHLSVGQCVNDAAAFATNGPDSVSSVPVIDCSQPHDSEVYANVTVKDTEYPGDEVMGQQAEQLCEDQFEAYIGASYDDATDLEISTYSPSSDTWEVGDRSVTCEVDAMDDDGNAIKVTGSLKGLKGALPSGS
jgi:hypothetical protein